MKVLIQVMMGLVALLISASSGAQTSTEVESTPAASKLECVEKLTWKAADKDQKAGFYKVKECKIKCSGGETSTTCRANETCHCECRSSGQPGCSCHPKFVDGEKVAALKAPAVVQSSRTDS